MSSTPMDGAALKVYGRTWIEIGRPRQGMAYDMLCKEAHKIVVRARAYMQRRGMLSTFEADDDEPVQAAVLAALEALPRWDPDKGALYTFLFPYVRSAMLDAARDKRQHGIGSRAVSGRVRVVSIDAPTADDALTSFIELVSSDGIGRTGAGAAYMPDIGSMEDPEAVAQRDELAQRVLSQLSMQELRLLRALQRGETLPDIAKRRKISTRTAQRMLSRIIAVVKEASNDT